MVIINPELVEPLRGLPAYDEGFCFSGRRNGNQPQTRSHYHPTRHISNPPKSMPLFLLFFIDTERALTGLAGL